MNNLLDSTVVEETKYRISQLNADSKRQWGSMTVAQTLAHCISAMEMASGRLNPKRLPFPTAVIGPILTPLFLRLNKPFRPNSNTAPELLPPVATECELERERMRLIESIDDFVRRGGEKRSHPAHPFFGRLNPRQWAILMHKHLDHHLRQFGV